MTLRRGEIEDLDSVHEIVISFIPPEGISEEYLFDKLAALGFTEFELKELLLELADNGVIYRKAGVWCVLEDPAKHLNLASKVGYRVQRNKDGKKFVITLTGDLSSLDQTDDEYISRET